MSKLNQIKKIVFIAILVFSPLVISFVGPTKASAAASLTGHEADGTEIWTIAKNPAAFPDIQTIPVGSYGNGITAPLISLRVSGNTTLKILGPHTFYNLTVDDGATITSDALSMGVDYQGGIYSIGSSYPLNPSAQNKIIDLTVKEKLTVNGTISADGLGFSGGHLPYNQFCVRYGDGTCAGWYAHTQAFFTNPDVYLWGRGQGPGGGASRVTYANEHSAGAGGGFGGKGGAGFACDDAYCTREQTEVPAGMPAPGVVYGSVGDFGSGGGYANHDQLNEPVDGGAGGGVIKIQAKEISMSTDSKISANGLSGTGSGETAGGAGSGGSISLQFNQGSIKQPFVKAGVNPQNYLAWKADDGQVTINAMNDHVNGGTDNITANGGNGAAYAGAGGGGRIYVGPLSLIGSLSADPASGIAPLSTTLTATASGSDEGTLNYTFWWNCESASSNVGEVSAAGVCGSPNDPTKGAKFDAVDVLTKSVSRTYGSAGVYHPKVIIERGAATPVTASTTVTVTAPTLTSALSANPTSGVSPLSTTLTASAGGTATGTLNYSIWWDCDNGTTSVASAIAACGNPSDPAKGVKYDATSSTTKTVSHIYSTGFIHAKVIIERGTAAPATSIALVNVQAPPCVAFPDQTQTVSCPAGQVGAITQGRRSTCPGPVWGAWTTTSTTCAVAPPTSSGNINFTQDSRNESTWPPGFRDLQPLSSISK
ncbi:MAG: hypothetical protein WCG99_00295 [Candidatus Berkelbacteria bacterium]